MDKKAKNIPQKAPAIKKIRQQQRSTAKKRDPFMWTLLLFGAAFLVHVILNMVVNKAPRFIIDEGLYTNIARSLAWDGELAFRGQPINYPYLLYPFLLVPVYWLNRICGGDVYRYVQVFNTLLVTSSVIPTYLFARDFTKDDKKALWSAFLVSLMPDMLMGGLEMTECLIWPLSLWMFFFCYRCFTGQRLWDGLLTALFAGLMFACKPGAIAMGAVLLTVNLILSLKRKQNVLQAALFLLELAVIVAVVYGVFLLLFDGRDSILGLYEKQTASWEKKDIWVAIEAFFLTIFLFVFACGGLFALFPYAHLQDYDRDKRTFVVATAIGVLAAVAGTAVFVVPYQWSGEVGHLPLHLRYCAMYIPLMYVFTVDLESCNRKSKAYIIALIVFILLSIFPGVRMGFVPKETCLIDSLVLSAFTSTNQLNGVGTGWMATLFVIIFSLLFLMHALDQKASSKMKNAMVFRIGNIFFALFLLLNAICAHIHANNAVDPAVSADASEVNCLIGSKHCLGITQRNYNDIYSYWLDGRLNVPMQQVTSDQIFVQMMETEGVYSPFIPEKQSPNVNNHLTWDTDMFVLGMTIAEHLELSESILSAEQTEHGHFTVVRIDPSNRWVDSMMYGLDDNSLYPGVEGYIRVFDDDRNMCGFLHVTITAAGNGYLCIGDQRITLAEQKQTYECTVPFSKMIKITAEEGTAQIFTYSTRKN